MNRHPGPAGVLCALVAGAVLSLQAAAAAGYEINQIANRTLPGLAMLTFGLWAVLVLGWGALAWRWLGRGAAPAETPAPDRGGQGLGMAKDWGTALGLSLLMVFAAMVTCLILQPDVDDYYYIPNVVHALTFPGQPITAQIQGIDASPLAPFTSSYWATAVAYDYLAGSIAVLTGLNHLDIRYFLLPALGACVFIAGLFLLLSRVCADDRQTLAATIAVVALYLLWHSAHRDPGSFAFPRFFQGKALVLTALLPLYAAWLWGFLRQPSALSGAGLAMLTLAAGGMTASAVPVLAGTALGVGAAVLAESPRAVARTLRNALLAAICSLPLALPVIHVLADPLPLGADSPANMGWPTTVAGQARFISAPSWALLLATLLVVGLLQRGPARRALLAWTAAVGVLLLNPLSGQWLLETVTGPNIFWRMFYVLPWAPLAGLAALSLAALVPAIADRRVAAATTALALSTLIAFGAPHSAIRFNWTWPPAWKLPHARVKAEAIIAAAPAGTMLAPPEMAGIIPSLDGLHPQLRIRRTGLRVWALHAGAPELAERRLRASDGLSDVALPSDPAKRALALAALRDVLAESRPTSVVIRKGAAMAGELSAGLGQAGYALHANTAQYEIWVAGQG